jgi:hypothetical protein
MRWIIRGKGHKNISAKHSTTLEFTRDAELTPRGDCIVAVACDQGLCDIPLALKKFLLKGGVISIKIACEGVEDILYARGSEKLTFSHANDIVIRKSEFVDGRTLAICATKAACDLRRDLVERLKNPNANVEITISPVNEMVKSEKRNKND